MAFTSWSDLRDDLKDKLADFVANGNFLSGSVMYAGNSGSRQLTYRSIDELQALIRMTYEMEAIETPFDPKRRKSFGRFRRY